MPEVVTWAALTGAVLALVGLLQLWRTSADRVSDAKAKADTAFTIAEAAKAEIAGVNSQMAAQISGFALYREQIAKEVITRDMMREFETRVAEAARENANRLSREIGDVGKRIDEVLLAVMPKRTK